MYERNRRVVDSVVRKVECTYLADLEDVGDAGEKLGVDAEAAVERVTGACDQALSKFSARWLDNR